MSKKTGALIFFSIIILFLYAFGVEFFEGIWSFPSRRMVPFMVIGLLGTGIFTTFYLRFPQIRYLKHGLKVTRGVYDDPNEAGDLNHFQALTTALSATVGIGNIAGVATALYYGGPGALFWMWITAFFGSALKYAECTLDLKANSMMPIHWGSFTLSLHSWTDPIERVTKKANEMNIPLISPVIGEITKR